MLLDYVQGSMLHRYHHARASQCLETLQRNDSGRSCLLCRKTGGGDRLPGAERVWEVNHHEDDHRPDPDERRRHSVRWRADRAGSHGLEAAHGLRAGGAASLWTPERAGVPGDGWPVAALARQAHSRKDRWPAASVLAAWGPACPGLFIFEGHAAEGADLRGIVAQPRTDPSR